VPSEEDGGLTTQRVVILGAHLFLSLAHVFAVHQSAEENGMTEREGDDTSENHTSSRTYTYSSAIVVFLAEVLKLLFSIAAYVHTHTREGTGDWALHMKHEV